MRLILVLCLIISPFTFAMSDRPTFVEYDPDSILPAKAEQVAALRERLAQVDQSPSIVERLLEIAQFRAEPMPLERIVYEGRVSNDPDRIRSVEHLLDMDRLAAWVWLTRLEPESVEHRRQAARLLLAWVKTYRPTGNDVNENKLAACFAAFDELHNHLDETDREKVRDWLLDIARKNLANASRLTGNRLAKANKIVALAATVCDDQELRDRGLKMFGGWLEQVLHSDGRSIDLDRRDAMHYHASALRDALEVASILHTSEIDLFRLEGSQGQSVEKSLRFMLPYIRGEKVYAEWVNTTIALDRRRWEAGDEFYRPGKPWPRTHAVELLILAGRFDPQFLELARTVVAEEDVSLSVFNELDAKLIEAQSR